MNFFMMGSVNSYVRNMGMQSKWKRKKDTGDFSKEEKMTPTQRKNEMFKKAYMEQKAKENNDEAMTSIQNKINAGAKLTPDEMKYLQAKDPALYQKLISIEKEKKEYERDLRKCRTKNEVERLKFSKVCESLSAIGAVKNNPNIPEGFKLGVAAQEMRRLNELDKIAAKFVQSGEYEKLPTDAEKAKAEKEIKEAEQAEFEKICEGARGAEGAEGARGAESEGASVAEGAKSKSAEGTEGTRGAESSKAEDVAKGTKSEAAKPKVAEGVKSEAAKPDYVKKTEAVSRKVNIPDAESKSRVEAESTPEALKLKRSKAKSAYIKSADHLADAVQVHVQPQVSLKS